MHDLQAGPPPCRAQARLAVRDHGLDPWLDLLELDEGARTRVLALLAALAY